MAKIKKEKKLAAVKPVKEAKIEEKVEAPVEAKNEEVKVEAEKAVAPVQPTATQEGKFHTREVKDGHVVINKVGQVVSKPMPLGKAQDMVLKFNR